MSQEYTFNPEIDFKDNEYVLDLYNFFKSSILYHIYLLRYRQKIGNIPAIPSIAQYVFDHPYEFEAIVCNTKVHANEIFEKINNEEFNGERVLFNDIDKFKHSPFFNDFCLVIDYIEHMPNLDKMIQEIDDKAKQNYERKRNEEIKLVRKINIQ